MSCLLMRERFLFPSGSNQAIQPGSESRGASAGKFSYTSARTPSPFFIARAFAVTAMHACRVCLACLGLGAEQKGAGSVAPAQQRVLLKMRSRGLYPDAEYQHRNTCTRIIRCEDSLLQRNTSVLIQPKC